MRAILAPLISLLLGTSLLLLGHGLVIVLVPVYAQAAQFNDIWVGVIGSAYFVGFNIGCFACPLLITRVGHIRTFAALAGVAGALPLLLILYPDPIAWIAGRIATGLCLAGLYMVIESWLNDQATAETRGRIVSIYVMVNMLSLAGGAQLLNLDGPTTFRLFAIGAILTVLALVPVSLTRSPSPAAPQQAWPKIRRLISLSAVAFYGCVAIGVANGAFFSLMPLYGRDIGLSVADVAGFMSLAIVGGALAQWPAGWTSDRIGDRRYMVGGLGAAAALICVALVFGKALPPGLLFALAFLLGTTIFPIYGICVAHANDHADRKEFVEVSAGLLLAYGIGATAGPFAASVLMRVAGPEWLFVLNAVAYLLLAVYVVMRLRRRPAVAPDQRGRYVQTTRTTPALYELDPRSPSPEDQEDQEHQKA